MREPSSNCNIRIISKNDEEIDERYFELDSDLKNKELFDFVDLDQYAPNDPIKKHNFIRDIQLSVPAGLYRLVFSNSILYKKLFIEIFVFYISDILMVIILGRLTLYGEHLILKKLVNIMKLLKHR